MSIRKFSRSKDRPYQMLLTLSEIEWQMVQALAKAQKAKTGKQGEVKLMSPAAATRAALYMGFHYWAAFEDEELDTAIRQQRAAQKPLGFGHYGYTKHGQQIKFADPTVADD